MSNTEKELIEISDKDFYVVGELEFDITIEDIEKALQGRTLLQRLMLLRC